MAREGALPTAHPTDGIVGHCPAIQALRAQLRHLAAFDAVGNPHVPTLLLQGETGTGKGLVARSTHDSGPRAHGPFIEVNCAAIPEALLEAELFGFEAGAFTDAKRPKPGLFEAADGGTLFLSWAGNGSWMPYGRFCPRRREGEGRWSASSASPASANPGCSTSSVSTWRRDACCI
jgi:transcriptional regulator with PAS, ATPase and Fis domain